MMKPRKPKRGVCGVCGCFVVAPNEKALDWDLDYVEINGHEYENSGYWKTKCHFRLVRVRCPKCGGHNFPAKDVYYDWDGTVLM